MVDFSNTGSIWVVTLDESETQQLPAILGATAPLALAAGPMAPVVLGAIGAAVPYIIEIDKLGGHRGVDINGVVGATGSSLRPG